MDEKTSKPSDEVQVKVYKDRQGRGWGVTPLWSFKARCYSVGCDSKAALEMVRISGTLARRELLCQKCFAERSDKWGLQYTCTTE